MAGVPPGSIDAAQIASLRRRYPRTFSRTPLQRAMLAAILLGLLAFVVFASTGSTPRRRG